MENLKEPLVKTKWELDPAHSSIEFKVKHLRITNVKGEFKRMNGEVITQGEELADSKINIRLDATSIFTNDDKRDEHLRAKDFFDVEKYKDITFEGSSFKKKDDTNYELKGMLTMKGISKEINLDVEFGGINKDPFGNEKAGFSVTGKLNRKDWGLNWNAALETGGVLVSDEVKINAEVQFIKQDQ
jgi:polyisoprenoid-binding protein YceI